jgi:hypothetical protein
MYSIGLKCTALGKMYSIEFWVVYCLDRSDVAR